MTCDHSDNTVTQSRVANSIRVPNAPEIYVACKRRRRHCNTCGYRWTTYELEDNFVNQFCRPPGRDEMSARHELKALKDTLALLSS